MLQVKHKKNVFNNTKCIIFLSSLTVKALLTKWVSLVFTDLHQDIVRVINNLDNLYCKLKSKKFVLKLKQRKFVYISYHEIISTETMFVYSFNIAQFQTSYKANMI